MILVIDILLKGAIDLLTAATNENGKAEKMLRLKILYLDNAFQKLIIYG